MTTKVLVVGDGPVEDAAESNRGINFLRGRAQLPHSSPYVADPTDHSFTVSTFIQLITVAGADIQVTTAQRGACKGADIQNFAFDNQSLDQWDVLWLFGWEGYNGQDPSGTTYGQPITGPEIESITAFMNGGGGVFATGDHEGMGSYMCGALPRVSTMRLWWYNNDGNVPTGYPLQAINAEGQVIYTTNWASVNGDTMNTWPTENPDVGSRLDTIVKNDADFAALNAGNPPHPMYDFAWQSDGIAQQLLLPGWTTVDGENRPHPIMLSPHGPITQIPDHMHEGEVVIPFQPDEEEYPTKWSRIGNATVRPLPKIIATGTMTAGHGTKVNNSTANNCYLFVGDTTPTIEHGPVGILCAYDGAPIGLGRIVTDSSFHHYVDINVIGDPCSTQSQDTQAGFGTNPSPGSVLQGLQTLWVNTVLWLAGGDPQLAHLPAPPGRI